MKITAIIIGVMLVAAGVAGAIDTPRQGAPQAMPEVRDGVAYTGIIKNKTRYEVSIPSENSDATLTIPPNSWIEYTIWTHQADVTAYYEGKPFYCLKLAAHPQEYSFMCSKYDFMAEIVKPEGSGRGKYKPMKKRKRIKKQTEA
ncbi:MAG: hypothetical protein ACLP2P_07885 [Desulfobaccales bacterium]